MIQICFLYPPSGTLIKWAGLVAITPGGESTICIAHRMARLVRLCDTPRVGIPVNSGAPGPNNSLEDEREFAFGIRFRSRCSGAGGGVGGRWWRWLLINWAGLMAITPGGENTIFIDHRKARLVRLCDTPRVGIVWIFTNSGAP